MGWKQPPSLIQTDNLTAAGVVNKTIIQRKIKSMDLRFHWLRCRKSQGNFRFYWPPGKLNWGDYSTKQHPPFIVPITAPNFLDMSIFSKRTKTSMKINNISLILDHFYRVTVRVYLSQYNVRLLPVTNTCNLGTVSQTSVID